MVGGPANHVEELALSGGLVIGDRRLDQVPGAVELVVAPKARQHCNVQQAADLLGQLFASPDGLGEAAAAGGPSSLLSVITGPLSSAPMSIDSILISAMCSK